MSAARRARSESPYERRYGFSRAVELAEANINLRVVERALEARAIDVITPDVRSAVEVPQNVVRVVQWK